MILAGVGSEELGVDVGGAGASLRLTLFTLLAFNVPELSDPEPLGCWSTVVDSADSPDLSSILCSPSCSVSGGRSLCDTLSDTSSSHFRMLFLLSPQFRQSALLLLILLLLLLLLVWLLLLWLWLEAATSAHPGQPMHEDEADDLQWLIEGVCTLLVRLVAFRT